MNKENIISAVGSGEKAKDVLANMKLREIADDRKTKKRVNVVLTVFAIIGLVLAIAGIVYAVYKYLNPEYLDDYSEDFEKDLDEDFFEDDDEDDDLEEK